MVAPKKDENNEVSSQTFDGLPKFTGSIAKVIFGVMTMDEPYEARPGELELPEGESHLSEYIAGLDVVSYTLRQRMRFDLVARVGHFGGFHFEAPRPQCRYELVSVGSDFRRAILTPKGRLYSSRIESRDDSDGLGWTRRFLYRCEGRVETLERIAQLYADMTAGGRFDVIFVDEVGHRSKGGCRDSSFYFLDTVRKMSHCLIEGGVSDDSPGYHVVRDALEIPTNATRLSMRPYKSESVHSLELVLKVGKDGLLSAVKPAKGGKVADLTYLPRGVVRPVSLIADDGRVYCSSGLRSDSGIRELTAYMEMLNVIGGSKDVLKELYDAVRKSQ